MPNWFYFSLNVSGEKKDVEQFVENVKGSGKYETEGCEFDFNHFIPQPDNIFREPLSSEKKKELDELSIPDWYNWNNTNWGTKWNAVCDDEMGISVDGFPFEHDYSLRTAWAFPSLVMEKMIDMYPNLDFVIIGEEESNSYGVYWSTSEDIYSFEEPSFIDEYNGRVVHYDNDVHVWKYMDDDKEVEDSDDFYPVTKYSWS